jgi:hypothetical protein
LGVFAGSFFGVLEWSESDLREPDADDACLKISAFESGLRGDDRQGERVGRDAFGFSLPCECVRTGAGVDDVSGDSEDEEGLMLALSDLLRTGTS